LTDQPGIAGRRNNMSIIGNILWILLGGGIFLFFEYALAGVVLCMTIIGIPFGYQMLKLALFALVPFGREAVRGGSHTGCLSTLFNVIWVMTGGLCIVVTHLIFGLICAVTIIGLPFARQHIKLAAFALVPFGTVVK
jgi:uncharacterized membrane protein YccF (DUF307 family)